MHSHYMPNRNASTPYTVCVLAFLLGMYRFVLAYLLSGYLGLIPVLFRFLCTPYIDPYSLVYLSLFLSCMRNCYKHIDSRAVNVFAMLLLQNVKDIHIARDYSLMMRVHAS